MVKLLKINATYKNQTHTFECTQTDFLVQAAEVFKIDDVKNVELYDMSNGKRRKIIQLDIIDMMRVLIEDKRARNSHQRTLDSYTFPKEIETVITKFENNTPLSGPERKDMILLLRNYYSNGTNKRKIDDVTPEKKHKKVQVNFSSTHTTECTTQTDKINKSFSSKDKAMEEEQITDKLKKLSSKPDIDKEEVAELMKASYDDRRVFISLKCPPVATIKEKYPFLFTLEEVKNELRRLIHSEITEEFRENMYKYAPLIIEKCKSEDLKKKTQKAMDRCHTNLSKKYAEVVGSVFILTHLMNEEPRFIHLQDHASGSTDIYPHIDASTKSFKELFVDASLYDIKVEGLRLCDASNFMEAILCLVAAFFIFNIDYPASCRQTMIMFEKLYLNANDTEDLNDETIQMVKLLKFQEKSLRKKK